jgi:hypothetical protein
MKRKKITSRPKKSTPKNAFVHGVYGSDLILPGEKRSEFDRLLEGVRRDLNPHGVLDDHTVFDIAKLSWRKIRAARFAQILLMRTSFVREIDRTGQRSAGAIVRSLNENNENSPNPDVQLHDAITSLRRTCQVLNRRRGVDKTDIEPLQAEIEKLRLIAETAAQRRTVADTTDVFAIIEWVTKIEIELDAEIDRKIKRLVMLNEYVRLYGQPASKLIGQSASTIIQSPPAHVLRSKRDQSKSDSKALNHGDNWEENDSDNDNDNDCDACDLDWEHEYDEEMEDLKKWKAKQARKR